MYRYYFNIIPVNIDSVSVNGRIVPEQVSFCLRKLIGKLFVSLRLIYDYNCLYCMKRANPIERFLKSPYYPVASVGLHRLDKQVDMGEVIEEMFVDVTGLKTVIDIYNALYPYYAKVLINFLEAQNAVVSKER